MPRIVIIGAGLAGITLATTLASKLTPTDNTEVVVLEKNAFFYHTYGSPRAFTDESYVKKMFIPFDNAIPKTTSCFVKIVRAVVAQISVKPRSEVTYRMIGADDQEVVGQDVTLAFDYLVVATGSNYPAPIKPAGDSYSRAHTETQLREVREQIEKAQKILVVGGGTVGCEVAGDIASKFPNKSVTIIDASPVLLGNDGVTSEFRDCVHDALTNRLKVNLILGERLMSERLASHNFVKQTLMTDKGTEIESDIQLLCGGFSPVSTLVQDMDVSLVDDKGFIRVNPQLQVTGGRDAGTYKCYSNIFALGDASNHPSPKQGSAAAAQARFLAGEFLAMLRQQQTEFTKPFPISKKVKLSLPLGPDGGFTQFDTLVVGEFLTSHFKSKEYFAPKFWKMFKATMPPPPSSPPSSK